MKLANGPLKVLIMTTFMDSDPALARFRADERGATRVNFKVLQKRINIKYSS